MSMREQEEQLEQAFVVLADERGYVRGWTSGLPAHAGSEARGENVHIGDLLPAIDPARWTQIWTEVIGSGTHLPLTLSRTDAATGTVHHSDVEICRFFSDGQMLAKVEVRSAGGANAKLALLQQEMLEAMANGVPLRELMDLMCRRAETFAPSATTSLLTIDDDGCLQHLASPSLPEDYCEAVNGIKIGSSVGSCGTAAYLGIPVETVDIASDPIWADYKHLVLPLGLRACWSCPIKSSKGAVLGVMGFYFPTTRRPSPVERQIVATCVHICSIALEHEKTRQNIYKLAFRDPLTQLDNRIRFQQRLDEALRLIRDTKQRLAIYYIGLDRFHLVNDTLGHAQGDQLLRIVAERLSDITKSGDILARIGGDEFAVVRVGSFKEQDIAKFARKLIEHIERPHTIDGQQLVVQAGVGIALAPDDAADPEELVKHAASALHRMKGRSKGMYQFYERDLDLRMRKRRKLEIDMREALEAGEFELHYQPIVAADDMKLRRAEALLRWHHRERGTVEPAEFIPIAEETGLIIPLGAWVIEEACARVAAWPEDVGIAINLSPIQFESQDLFPTIANAIAKNGLRPSRLQVEVTESVLLRDSAVNLALLDELNELGVSVALDDFGTGYSSLSYLQKFPFDSIKIDRSFIQNICSRREALKIVRSIIMLAHSLGLRVTAEGVETDAQFGAMRGEGCDDIQGHYVSGPLPLRLFERMLATAPAKLPRAKSAS